VTSQFLFIRLFILNADFTFSHWQNDVSIIVYVLLPKNKEQKPCN